MSMNSALSLSFQYIISNIIIYLQYVQYVGQKIHGKSISHESDFFKEKSMPVGSPQLRLLLTGILQKVLL